VDFYKAFDTINHATLWLVLSRTGVQGKMLNMLRGMYQSVKSCVRCAGGDLTDYFECLQGLKQGCLCSPILFSYFINELANDITRGGTHGIQLLPNQIELFLMLFADDLALLSSTVRGLQNQLNLLHEASQRLGLKVNTGKTKIMVFRKGGHLAASETWHLGDENLEVVGRYKYLGLNFSTMLSFNIATDEFVSRAKKGVFEIARALKAYGCHSCTVFFKLFDSQIMPSLLYASELWGYKENKRIEKVHLYAIKLFINVPVRTPTDMIYAEVGRHPLCIESAIRCVQYWFKVLKQDDTRYSKMAYRALLAMHERGNVNWVTKIKKLLCECGFELVWMFGGVANEKQFCRELKERLKANFSQRWFDHIQESNRFDMYRSFKDCIGKEIYVDMIKVSIYRVALARFRMGVSPFNAHRHRYNRQEASRNCPFCLGQVECEVHVIFVCPEYAGFRARYLNLVDTVDMREQIRLMLVSHVERDLVGLAKFLYLAWRARTSRLQSEQ
jgi:Reverse transcriptase (RNA-dependent DNA polymerase)